MSNVNYLRGYLQYPFRYLVIYNYKIVIDDKKKLIDQIRKIIEIFSLTKYNSGLSGSFPPVQLYI